MGIPVFVWAEKVQEAQIPVYALKRFTVHSSSDYLAA
jgi:hypothetical protein